MRILHITEYCHAGSVGGTERYILDLVHGLAAAGIDNLIGWLRPGHASEPLEADGVRIVTLPSPPMRVDAPPAEFQGHAEQLLEAEKPDCVHFHTFGLTEAALAKLAKQRGIPYVFTYHSPAWTCRNETLLFRNGQVPCDGEVRAWRCSTCQSKTRLGMGTFGGPVAAAISLAGGWTMLPLGSTSLRRRTAFFYDTWRYGRALRHFLMECDLVVSCCDWSDPVLLRNGAKQDCMIQCPQGVSSGISEALQTQEKLTPSAAGKEFIVGYVGRVVEVKGVHILMQGFSLMKDSGARLRIVGLEVDQADQPYAKYIKQLRQADPRITLVPKKTLGDTLAEYQHFSLLAVPSIWLETGPLTMLEALALGVPVYGSNRIGQLSLLRQQGRIVEPNTPEGWQAALSEAMGEFKAGKWSERRKKIRDTMKLRTMTDVAAEMKACYQNLLAS